MRPVSQTFLDTVRGSHQAIFRARVVSGLQTSTNPTGGTEIPIIEGDVTFDVNSDVNASCDVTVKIDWPANSSAVGAPYGQELFIERGVQYGNGIKEWVGLGYFRINSVEQSNAPKGTIRITGEDRMAMLRDARPLAPVQYFATDTISSVINSVVSSVINPVTIVYPDWTPSAIALGSDHILEDDRIQFLQDIVTAYGRVMYFDYQGRLVIKQAPTVNPYSPAYEVNVGRNGVLCTMSRTISRDGVYNAVVATGEPVADQPPVRGVAFDLVTTSPTYYLGPFGQVPRFFSSSFLLTNDQATSAATSILSSSLGLPYVVQLGVVPNPALEGWDVLRVTYDQNNQAEIHVVDTVTYSLSADGPMSIATKKKFLT